MEYSFIDGPIEANDTRSAAMRNGAAAPFARNPIRSRPPPEAGLSPSDAQVDRVRDHPGPLRAVRLPVGLDAVDARLVHTPLQPVADLAAVAEEADASGGRQRHPQHPVPGRRLGSHL